MNRSTSGCRGHSSELLSPIIILFLLISTDYIEWCFRVIVWLCTGIVVIDCAEKVLHKEPAWFALYVSGDLLRYSDVAKDGPS
jgi:hypothetical protein